MFVQIGIPAKWKLCLEMDKKKEQLEVWLTLETKPKEVKTIFAKWEVEIRKADSSDQVYEQRGWRIVEISFVHLEWIAL
jgi:hypothetical protein